MSDTDIGVLNAMHLHQSFCTAKFLGNYVDSPFIRISLDPPFSLEQSYD